jgi:hypothetical protein
VVFDLPCCHKKFSILSVELDVFQHGPEFFPETTEPVEIRPPDPKLVPSEYRRPAKPTVRFEP